MSKLVSCHSLVLDKIDVRYAPKLTHLAENRINLRRFYLIVESTFWLFGSEDITQLNGNYVKYAKVRIFQTKRITN